MSLSPCAALEVIVREHEHDRFVAPALADEAILVTICGGSAYCHCGRPELGVE